jgi:transcriptional regulator with XRE-family HTH domain
MERPGERLKRARERLNMTYRDVEQASQAIAQRHKSDEFAIALSRLADIENKGITPSIYRLYSLCVMYGIDYSEILQWYDLDIEAIPSESTRVPYTRTQLLRETPDRARSTIPLPAEIDVDLNQTTFLSRVIRRWGKSVLTLLNGVDVRTHRFGLIGMEDWSMYPILHPGSMVIIDENNRKITSSGWNSELDRPIYFFEHRDGFCCAWASMAGERLLIQPHPSSTSKPALYDPDEVDILGRVVGTAMLFEHPASGRKRAALA